MRVFIYIAFTVLIYSCSSQETANSENEMIAFDSSFVMLYNLEQESKTTDKGYKSDDENKIDPIAAQLTLNIERKIKEIKELQNLAFDPQLDPEMKEKVKEAILKIYPSEKLLLPDFEILDVKQNQRLSLDSSGYHGVFDLKFRSGTQSLPVHYESDLESGWKLSPSHF